MSENKPEQQHKTVTTRRVILASLLTGIAVTTVIAGHFVQKAKEEMKKSEDRIETDLAAGGFDRFGVVANVSIDFVNRTIHQAVSLSVTPECVITVAGEVPKPNEPQFSLYPQLGPNGREWTIIRSSEMEDDHSVTSKIVNPDEFALLGLQYCQEHGE